MLYFQESFNSFGLLPILLLLLINQKIIFNTEKGDEQVVKYVIIGDTMSIAFVSSVISVRRSFIVAGAVICYFPPK